MDTRRLKDLIARKLMFMLCIGILSIVFLIAVGLYIRSLPILVRSGIRDILFSSLWRPTEGRFGLAAFVAGTVWVTTISMVIAIPLGIFTALYLSEYCHKRTRELVKPVIDVLAGISPVIYGFWGMVTIVPLVRDHIMPFCVGHFPFFPFLSDNYTGFCVLTAGIVLAVMVLPIIIAIAEEVLSGVPFSMREASLALGATKWQTVKGVVLKKARPGIFAAVILGLSRAFGETMAVLMVAGCAMHVIPRSLFDPAYPLPALIANTYGEMMSIPLYDAAVLLAALMLFLVTVLFNIVGWKILGRMEDEA
ncbi:MAG: phosphate ABC transporter permease subunit PstC [Candidatus Omnitrophica bacterium]|nr:phosphate ABC transporter permease subunit PstC [Candidatus Omnitrophota bacterium]MCM8790549.1 phosphate ABC transporter permease subunit PstC [Candidatus Omnitrophota bacterium]